MNLQDNNIKQQIGFWIRPDQNFNKTQYAKLYLDDQSKYNNELSWKNFGNNTNNDFILNFVSNCNKWLLYKSNNIYQNYNKYENDIIFDKSKLIDYNQSSTSIKYMHSDIHSMLEKLDEYDVSWSRIHNINQLFLDYNGKDIVWKITKFWTNSLNDSKTCTIENVIWLDKYQVLDDGSDKWFCLNKKFTKVENGKVWLCEEIGDNYIIRKKTNESFETADWTAEIPLMFQQHSHIAALHNSQEIYLSYIMNNPLQVKYVIAQAVKRDLYNIIISKNKNWSVYRYYNVFDDTDLYLDDCLF